MASIPDILILPIQYSEEPLILDAAKLSFVSLVLGTVIKGDIPQVTLLTAGIIASASGALFGLIILTLLEEK